LEKSGEASKSCGVLGNQIVHGAEALSNNSACVSLDATPPLENLECRSEVSAQVGYARGDVTTNTIEDFFSIFKRGTNGVYARQADGKQIFEIAVSYRIPPAWAACTVKI
jgi:hypothetical protein